VRGGVRPLLVHRLRKGKKKREKKGEIGHQDVGCHSVCTLTLPEKTQNRFLNVSRDRVSGKRKRGVSNQRLACTNRDGPIERKKGKDNVSVARSRRWMKKKKRKKRKRKTDTAPVIGVLSATWMSPHKRPEGKEREGIGTDNLT